MFRIKTDIRHYKCDSQAKVEKLIRNWVIRPADLLHDPSTERWAPIGEHPGFAPLFASLEEAHKNTPDTVVTARHVPSTPSRPVPASGILRPARRRAPLPEPPADDLDFPPPPEPPEGVEGVAHDASEITVMTERTLALLSEGAERQAPDEAPAPQAEPAAPAIATRRLGRHDLPEDLFATAELTKPELNAQPRMDELGELDEEGFAGPDEVTELRELPPVERFAAPDSDADDDALEELSDALEELSAATDDKGSDDESAALQDADDESDEGTELANPLDETEEAPQQERAEAADEPHPQERSPEPSTASDDEPTLETRVASDDVLSPPPDEADKAQRESAGGRSRWNITVGDTPPDDENAEDDALPAHDPDDDLIIAEAISPELELDEEALDEALDDLEKAASEASELDEVTVEALRPRQDLNFVSSGYAMELPIDIGPSPRMLELGLVRSTLPQNERDRRLPRPAPKKSGYRISHTFDLSPPPPQRSLAERIPGGVRGLVAALLLVVILGLLALLL
ncbi:hypothetical protein DL240_09545 [Lujinxingia litoralis]|uniref:Uncharacterized protein n=1 Tax=Lujinxingia litoralis TaxID=2211119 RepID=A0A328C7C5_9DELT|nr:hypothetical protein [Lujinxingia litoralis]RAL23116.1 hypothetical protein DL240_09545 [Lujinxingia litoralis]